MRRYVIIGAGAIGATVGAQLALAEIPTVLIARGSHAEALRGDGLRYYRPDSEHTLHIETASAPDELELTEDDVLVLATKSQDTERALQTWARHTTNVPILTLQNGMENERAALRRFPLVLGTVVWLPASHLSPGEVVARAKPMVGAFWIGKYPSGESLVADEIAADLRTAGFHANTVPDIINWKASKLLGNLANVLDALYQPSDLRNQAAKALREEGLRVLKAHGIEPVPQIGHAAEVRADVVATEVPRRTVPHSSTWQSLTRNSSVETDYLNGEIVLLARLANLKAPLNEAAQRRMTQAIHENTKPGSLTDKDLTQDLPTP